MCSAPHRDHLPSYYLRDRSVQRRGNRRHRATKNTFRNEPMCDSHFNLEDTHGTPWRVVSRYPGWRPPAAKQEKMPGWCQEEFCRREDIWWVRCSGSRDRVGAARVQTRRINIGGTLPSCQMKIAAGLTTRGIRHDDRDRVLTARRIRRTPNESHSRGLTRQSPNRDSVAVE